MLLLFELSNTGANRYSKIITMKKIDPHYQKILLILVISFIAVKIFNNTIFIANTPRFNPKFISQIQSLPKNIAAVPHQLAELFKGAVSQNSINKQTAENNNITTGGMQAFMNLPQVVVPKTVKFTPLVKGVLAGEDTNTKTKYVTIEKGTKVQVYEFKVTMHDGSVKNMRFVIPVKE